MSDLSSTVDSCDCRPRRVSLVGINPRLRLLRPDTQCTAAPCASSSPQILLALALHTQHTHSEAHPAPPPPAAIPRSLLAGRPASLEPPLRTGRS
jgi:hypothetical protein